MDDATKYLIHADIRADGVVERSDVVGAIYGQTEGLLGDELDLHDLQQASRVGRIDVTVESEGGRSAGEITVASQLDKVETAILAAALESLDRVGPCEATVRVTGIEDVRAAKRRQVVARAKELLGEAFDEDLLSSQELIEEVRESVRVARIDEYEGLPAGPRVATGDAIVLVEGRSDVLTLLRYGVKNAIAVEGTNVPTAVADLTRSRHTTAFLDGDRGGDLILRELVQVADVDAVARAPPDRSVEDLERHEVRAALREKAPVEVALAAIDAAVTMDEPASDGGSGLATVAEGAAGGDAASAAGTATESSTADDAAAEPETLAGHVRAVIGASSGEARLLDATAGVLETAPVDGAFEAVRDADPVPAAVVLDGPVDQRLLDVLAQRGVEQVVGRGRGEYTKQPTTVRVRTADEFDRAG